jgi:hypothetical protein
MNFFTSSAYPLESLFLKAYRIEIRFSSANLRRTAVSQEPQAKVPEISRQPSEFFFPTASFEKLGFP